MSIESNELDIKIAFSLEKMMQVQRILLWEVAKNENLSPIQIQIMIFLNSHREELRKISILADEFDLTKATISDAVSNLESKGIITKSKTETDKRSYIIDFTPKGKKILFKIDKWQEQLVDQVKKFPRETKENVLTFFTELIKSLFDSNIISIARMCLTCANVITGSDKKPYTCRLTGRTFNSEEIEIECDHYQARE